MLKVKKATEMKIDPTNIGLYGANGTGKTTLAATLPGKIVVFDINEKGLSSVSKKDLERIAVVEITKFEEMIEILKILQEEKLAETLGFKPDSVVVDTVTQIAEIFEIWADENPQKFLSTKGAFDKFKVYREMNRFAKLFLMSLKKIGTKNIFLFQEKEVTNEDGIVVGNTIRVTSGVKNIFLSELDIIGRTLLLEKDDKTNYVVDFRAKQNNDIKVRKSKDFGALTYILDPSYEKLEKEVNNV